MKKNRKIIQITALTAILSIYCGTASGVVAIADTTIIAGITADLEVDDAVSAHFITVSSENGIVELNGSVDNILARDRAEEIAGTIKGVRGIVNQVRVKPVDRADVQIRNDVISALAFDSAVDAAGITVQIQGRGVRLRGTVHSFTEKKIVTRKAKSVAGVVQVENNIEIVPPKERSNDDIKKDILRWYSLDPLIRSQQIEVSVRNGMVALSGTVGSIQERKAAIQKADVAGVVAIDAKELEIKEWAQDWLRRKKSVVLSDSALKKSVFDVLSLSRLRMR